MGTAASLPGKYEPLKTKELAQYEVKDGPYWRAKPDDEFPIRVAAEGVASSPPTTVMALLKTAVDKAPDQPAMRVEIGEGDVREWKTWTWKEYYADVMRAGRALIKFGLKPHASINIIGFNSPEWFIADLGAIAAGGMAAGIYTTNAPDACKYITEHSEARVVVVEGDVQLQKFLKIRNELPNLAAIVVYRGVVPAGVDQSKSKVITWEEFLAFGSGEDQKELDEQLAKRISDQKPGHGCTLIYTSGTTGPPKAVMLSQDNITWTARSVLELLPGLGQPQRTVSYLPLSHVAAQMLDIHAPIVLTACNSTTTVSFARPDALKGSLGITLKAARPTIFFGVPRVWEKMREKMLSIGKGITGLKRMLADWAKSQSLAKYRAEEVYPRAESPYGVTHGAANAVILTKVREALGLDQCGAFFTGAAPIALEVLDYFGSLGIVINEIYGMSESSGPHTCCRWYYRQSGSVGVPFPGVETRIDHVEGRDRPGEGEICFRGRHVMMGYLKDAEKTQQAIDPEGWLHSGDVGRVDEKHLTYITGRIKELIITAGGENIAPVPVEEKVKKELPGISNIMMVGDRRKFNTCLISLYQELDEKSGDFTNKLTGASLAVSANSKTVEEAQKDPVWQKYIEDGIKRANAAAVSNAAKIQKFKIISTDFSVNTGELTPTLKLKRPFVAQKYDAIIEEMYAGADE